MRQETRCLYPEFIQLTIEEGLESVQFCGQCTVCVFIHFSVHMGIGVCMQVSNSVCLSVDGCVLWEKETNICPGQINGLVNFLSRVRLFATPWTVAYQAPPYIGLSSQEYWSGLPFPSPGDLPDSGIEPRSPALQADALTSEPSEKPNKWFTKCKSLFSCLTNCF